MMYRTLSLPVNKMTKCFRNQRIQPNPVRLSAADRDNLSGCFKSIKCLPSSPNPFSPKEKGSQFPAN